MDTYPIVADTDPGETCAWLRERGYNATVVLVYEAPGNGVLFARGNDPARIAVPEHTLAWDGTDVTVQDA